MKFQIPFFRNKGYRCGQTCAAMMIKYFIPEFKPDFNEMDEIIEYEDGKYTFPIQDVLLLDHYGISSKCYSTDDYKTTKEDPDIFHHWYGDEYDEQIKYVDIPTFNKMVTKARKKNLFTQKKTSLNEILQIINDQTLVAICVDDITLHGKSGSYKGHSVVISGTEGNNVYIHDPDDGPFIKYSKDILEKAYNHPIISDDCTFAFGRKVHT